MRIRAKKNESPLWDGDYVSRRRDSSAANGNTLEKTAKRHRLNSPLILHEKQNTLQGYVVIRGAVIIFIFKN